MATKALPPQDRLLKRLAYTPETGILIWRCRDAMDFPPGKYPAERVAKIWNGKFAGTPALACPTTNGYLHGAFDSVDYLQHRIIWKLMTGEEPVEVDHENGNRSENKFVNLRAVGHEANMRNRKMSRNNRSGVTGVHLNKDTGLWAAQMQIGNRLIYLGRHSTIEAAQSARLAAEKSYGFSERHGL